jgi:hypothetical protein
VKIPLVSLTTLSRPYNTPTARKLGQKPHDVVIPILCTYAVSKGFLVPSKKKIADPLAESENNLSPRLGR